jgi:2-dehydropantoate 2-reductase
MATTDWHILGPGAIGSLFAWYLNDAHLRVKLLTRHPGESARLITLEDQGHLATHGFHVDHGASPIRRLLITVKAHQTATALDTIAHRITPDTVLLFLQNGMGAWQIAEQRFPDSPCLLGTTTEGAWRAADHHIVHAGRGETWIGTLQPRWQTAVDAVVQQWRPTLFKPKADRNILARLWRKLAINCAINPLTVLYDCRNGELLEKPAALAQMQTICQEVERVMGAALGAPAGQPLFELACEVARKTGANQSSMLQDYRRGNPTEIDFITGYLVREAARLGIAVPENNAVLTAIHQISGYG